LGASDGCSNKMISKTDLHSEAEGRAVVLFDGVCNLCNGAVQFIIKRDSHDRFRFASLQSQAAEALLGTPVPSGEDPSSIIVLADGRSYDTSDAILRIARDLGPAWSWWGVFRIVPKTVRDGLYRFIARNRYRWFGKRDSCMIPTPELKAKFLKGG